MEELLSKVMWRQYGAVIQMLRNAIEACPAEVWDAEDESPSFPHLAYHTMFFIDFYGGDSPEMLKAFKHQDFAAKSDTDLSKPPSKAFSKEELLGYLDFAEEKNLGIIESFDAEDFARPCAFEWKQVENVLELRFETLRHLNHHVGQLHYILHRETGSAPGWLDQITQTGK